MGINGTGKTTLLKTIAGILPALSGNISLDNQPISGYSAISLAQRRTLIWSQMPYISHFKVWDWVATAQYPHIGWQTDIPKQNKEFIEKILQKLGIDTWKNRLLHSLSDGEKQRVLIAYSLASMNDYLFFDEPTAHLDFVQKKNVFSQFKHLAQQEKKGVVVVSHEIEQVFQCADMILWLTEDNHYWYDSPKNMLQKDDFLTYLSKKDYERVKNLSP